MNPEPIPTAIAETIQEYSCSLKRTQIPKPIMIAPKVYYPLTIMDIIIKFDHPYVMEKKTQHSTCWTL